MMKWSYHSGHPEPQALMNCTGGVSGSGCQTREIHVTFFFVMETRNSSVLHFKRIVCKVTITGNQGVDVCRAVRQCVPLSVYTNSVLWLDLGRAAQSRKVRMTFPKPSLLSFQ